MLYSKLFGRSSKTQGSKLETKSHRLLIQAGYIRESVAGRYFFLPLGMKLQQKFMKIVKEEMDKSGALEVVAPVLHPLSLWEETNRDNEAGFELMQLKDRRSSAFALGGTAEEMFVDLVRKFNLSYKDLPFNLYQFGLKFRDELRARGGLLRVREFIMKDAYSFSTEAQFEAIYEEMKQVYTTIFNRVGLEVKVVAADGGYIGGDYCHEFIVDSDAGESVYYYTKAGYLAHEDVATFSKDLKLAKTKQAPLKQVKATRGPTMADSHKFHQPVALTQHLKNVAYKNENKQIIIVCLRGDLSVNEVKLQNILDCHQLLPLTNQEIQEHLNSEPGFISPVGLNFKSDKYDLVVVADDSVKLVVNAISGANKLNYDYVNINYGRDFKANVVADIALAQAEHKADDGQTLKQAKGIEVGNIFQLGYHYSSKMKGAEYIDQNGKPQRYYMGCYGIGIGRTLAAIAEVRSDDLGLVWPLNLSPFAVHLVGLSNDSSEIKKTAQLYKEISKAGIEVLYDDRLNVSAGQKLADADLLGFPMRIVVSSKTLKSNQIEIKLRTSKESQYVNLDQAVEVIDQELAKLSQKST